MWLVRRSGGRSGVGGGALLWGPHAVGAEVGVRENHTRGLRRSRLQAPISWAGQNPRGSVPTWGITLKNNGDAQGGGGGADGSENHDWEGGRRGEEGR